MAHLWQRIKGTRRYELLPLSYKEPVSSSKYRKLSTTVLRRPCVYLVVLAAVVSLYVFFRSSPTPAHDKSCDTIDDGYRCEPETSHFWGQYSLWFSVPSDIDVAPPEGCAVSFASVLSRHGGRDPTTKKTIAYDATIGLIQNTSTAYPGEFAFLKDYKYTLGANQLTDAGRQQMVNSGVHFYRRYEQFLRGKTPFVRSTDQDRVFESANKWLEGYAQAANKSPAAPIDVSIPEADGFNNTLSHSACPNFEDGPLSKSLGSVAQEAWIAKFIPPIQTRVNTNLGTNLTTTDIIYLMDLCPFTTLDSPTAQISDFCRLFTENEWHQYDYYQTLGKWYGYGDGHPLGATQGIGYVSELLARLTESPVQPVGSVNTTLANDPATFPLNRTVYADFSHDNDMAGVLAALRLYNATAPLSTTTLQDTRETHGYAAAWSLTFAARIYVEKLQCAGDEEEYVRVVVNDRVVPMEFCGADKWGRCRLGAFVEGMGFVRDGGRWGECYVG